MKLNANRETILQPLQAVIGVVERRQTMPILANVLLSARMAGCRLPRQISKWNWWRASKCQCRAPAISLCRDASFSISVVPYRMA